MRHLKLSILISSLVLATSAAQAAPVAKQLAGPPSEFAAMAEADLSQAAMESKSALIPIQLSTDRSGAHRWSASIPVESSNLRFAVMSGAGDDWRLSLRAPFARTAQDVDQLASSKEEMLIGMANNEYPADYYSFENLQTGAWQLEVEALSDKQNQGFILVNSDGPYRLRSYQTNRDQIVGERIGFTAASLTLANEFAAKQTGETQLFNNAYLRITAPDGETWLEAMFDDGLHNDERAGDGIFGGDFLAQQAGDYTAQVVAEGLTPAGQPLLRTAEHLVTVLERPLHLASSFATTHLVNDSRMMVNLALSDQDNQSQYRVLAEVWGHGGKGGREAVPVAWIGGMVEASNGVLSLGLDARWIALSGAQGPFELRNLRVEDPDHFIPLLRAEQLSMDVNHLPDAAFRAVSHIDESMLMGERPADLDTRAGSRLLLIHGYCGSDSWTPVAGQFTGEAIFRDLHQNRSHNQFAQLILNFGSSFSSYGIVAHSQGGAASLHLYTYYWSGLDYASGGRLIQSVGTPYQGTSLAGILAVLGQVFGAGCGTNNNLTYSGASAWLAGIPSWARGKVNYYTTSFRDRFLRYDYCHLVTDLLLNDPDDGTTERSRGQLSGAANRGHRTGWCHTTEMRDPGQVRDSNRNATMNANAAR